MTDMQSASTTGTYQVIPIDHLIEDGDNVRTVYDGIEDLAHSIWAVGLLSPLNVTQNGDDKYHIKAGHRRYRALQLLVKKKQWVGPVPAFVSDPSDDDADFGLAQQIVENLQRVDLNPVDEALGIQRLATEHGWTIEDISYNIARSTALVRDRLLLCQLGPEALAEVKSGAISLSCGLLLAKVTDPKRQVKLISIAKGKYADGNLERAIAEYKTKDAKAELVKVMKQAGIKASGTYPYNLSEVDRLDKATPDKLTKWLFDHGWNDKSVPEGLSFHITTDYGSDYFRVAACTPRAKSPTIGNLPVYEPSTLDELDVSKDVTTKYPEISEWYESCRAVALEIEAARVHQGQRMGDARVAFALQAGKADVAAAALRVVANNAIYQLYTMLISTESTSRTRALTLLGWKESTDTTPSNIQFNRTKFEMMVFKDAKLIIRCAAWGMTSAHDALADPYAAFVKETIAADLPEFPVAPEIINNALVAEQGETFEEANPDATFADIEVLVEEFSAWLTERDAVVGDDTPGLHDGN